jgi:DNA (cytosine-5)-methyltransferase 1
MHGTDHTGKTGRGGEFAAQATAWQTPAVDSFRSRGGDRKAELGLDQQARFFPTPQASDAKMVKGGKRGPEENPSLTGFACSLPAQTIPDGPQSSENAPTSRRRLNPRFVEWLMGFPIGWTEL